jgi:hypothetical protein
LNDHPKRRFKRPQTPDLFSEYLKRRPERNPAVLLPRSALALARGGFLLHGVLARGWPLGWLAAFLFAEFFLVVRLTVLGDRWAGGPSLDPQRGKKSLFSDLAWTIAAITTFYACGAKLDADTGALGLVRAASEASAAAAVPLSRLADLAQRPSWGVIAYLASFFVEFGVELVHSRAARVSYVASSALVAALFLTVVALGAILIPFVGVFVEPIFGQGSLRGAFAALLVVARSGAEVAVVWFPYWGHKLAEAPRATAVDES